jgi:hypothetical protein
MTPWQVLDLLGFVLALHIAHHWISTHGWDPRAWTGFWAHLFGCSFCLTFWLALIVTLILRVNPLHAFGTAAISWAFHIFFREPSEPPVLKISAPPRSPLTGITTAPKSSYHRDPTSPPAIEDDIQREFQDYKKVRNGWGNE